MNQNLSSHQFVDLYHRTTPEAAESIAKSGRFEPHDDATYFAKTRDMDGYGSSVVHARVPAHLVYEDEEGSAWDDGSDVDDADRHYMVDNEHLKREHIVGIEHEGR